MADASAWVLDNRYEYRQSYYDETNFNSKQKMNKML